MYLIEVYVTNSSLNINHPFTYLSLYPIDKYKRVRVKFANSENVAIVFKCIYTDLNKAELKEKYGYEILEIIEVIDEESIINDELFDLAFWLSRTTISPLISCLNVMLPKALKTTRNIEKPKTQLRIKKHDLNLKLTLKQEKIFNMVDEDSLLADARKLSTSITNKLIDLGYFEIYEKEVSYVNNQINLEPFKELTTSQSNVKEQFLKTDKMVSLLYGITGSGKTEVYLHLAREYLNLNKEVLILVPEISLTPQMIARVKERFVDAIFYHSGLTNQEKYEQYKRIKNKEAKIVVGTRSAIFLPFNDLGLIIVDEEHDISYYQENVPSYHVKNVAIKRAHTYNAKILLASATPSLESYTRALKGDYQLLTLKERINLTLPDIEIIDLNKQLRKKDSYIITKPLLKEIENTLNNNKQAIILLNRRGYAPVIKCKECSEVLKCTDCDVPLSYHNDLKLLKCHQCSKTYKIPKTCPNCHNESLIYYGFGTKRVEEELHKYFSNARIIRMDRDSVAKKGAHEKILNAFANKEYDILIGTQMIGKGLDFPDVTLVGILNADAALMHEDFNASKLTFDLLMQAAGRSGRANDKGKVIIQAFNENHYVLKAVLNQDYNYFYNLEMNYRFKANYPPYRNLLCVILYSENENLLLKSVDRFNNLIEEIDIKHYPPLELNRLSKQYRYRFMFMDKDLIKMLKTVQEVIDSYLKEKNICSLKVEINPLYLN